MLQLRFLIRDCVWVCQGQPNFYSKKLFEVDRHVVMLSREKKNIFSRGPPFLCNCLIDFMTLFSLSSN